MIFEVRPATAEDAQYVFDIDVKCFDYPWTEKKWHTSEYSVGVATLRKTPIGVVVFEIKDGHVVLEKLGVRPNFRNRGVSRQLMDEVVTASMYAGATNIQSIVPENLCDPNDPACIHGWLLKVGFRGVGVKRNHFTEGGFTRDAFTFRKDIK